jgi:cytochrome o ubiquinol oxidase subunit 1
MFGRLTLEAFKHDPIQMGAVFSMIFTGIGLIGLLSYFKLWKRLWSDWITTVDPKKIGVMYIIVVLIMFLKGFADAMMMRVQQALSVGDSHGILSAGHFQEVFSAHGTTMIFFVAMGAVFGLMNLMIPLHIGARDVAFPFINALGFWLFASAAGLMIASLAVGKFSTAGWLAYAPLSSIEYSPNEGVDYWIWIVQIAGVGSTLGGINFMTTILKMRCPGMTFMRMPIFVWSCLCALILIILAFPILTERFLCLH